MNLVEYLQSQSRRPLANKNSLNLTLQRIYYGIHPSKYQRGHYLQKLESSAEDLGVLQFACKTKQKL